MAGTPYRRAVKTACDFQGLGRNIEVAAGDIAFASLHIDVAASHVVFAGGQSRASRGGFALPPEQPDARGLYADVAGW